MQKKYDEYKELVYELKEKRNEFENESLKNLEKIGNIEEELICIICYRQIADFRIKPCNHRGCRECLLTYMADNNKCFMCRQPIKSLQKIPEGELKNLDIKNKENDQKEDEKIKEEKKENENKTQSNNNEDDDDFNFSDGDIDYP